MFNKIEKPRSIAAAKKPKENTTVYISNLNYKRDEGGIRRLFSRYGSVKKIKLVINQDTDRSKGMAFVEMGTLAHAKAAIAGLNQQLIDGRTLKASYAFPVEKPVYHNIEEDKAPKKTNRKPKNPFFNKK